LAGERKFIKENVRRVLLKEYLKEQVKRAGFGGVDIQRTPMGTRVLLITERPGLVIGRKGSSIKALTNAIEFDFGFDKPQVEVTEVENANLSAQIMAEKLASALERGWHFRRAGHSTVRRIMENGARGCQVIIAGKLTGQRHRTEKFKEGHIKFCGEPKLQWMEEGYTPAKLKQGVIGCKVQIMHPEARLPDEVKIMEPAEVKALYEGEEAEKEEAVEEPAPESKVDKDEEPPKGSPESEKKGKPKKEEAKKPEQKDSPEPKGSPESKDSPEPKKEEPKPAETKKAQEPKPEVKAPEEKQPEPEDSPEPKKAEEKPAPKPEKKAEKPEDSVKPTEAKTPVEKPPEPKNEEKPKPEPVKKEAKENGTA